MRLQVRMKPLRVSELPLATLQAGHFVSSLASPPRPLLLIFFSLPLPLFFAPLSLLRCLEASLCVALQLSKRLFRGSFLRLACIHSCRAEVAFSLTADAGRRRRERERRRVLGGRKKLLREELYRKRGRGRRRGQRTPESAKESDFGRCFFLPSSSLPLGRVLFLSLVCIRAIACKL